MKTTEIHWDLFWHAVSKQEADYRISWLGRWLFADDWVRLSMLRHRSSQTMLISLAMARRQRRGVKT